ncbi:MAG: YncE family protein [Thermoplasmata archaeon]
MGSGPGSGGVPEVGTPLVQFPVGSFPSSVLVDPTSGLTYVANEMTDNVTVISGGAKIASIGVGVAPVALVANGAGGLVYVIQSGSANVTVISGQSREATIAVGSVPTAGAFDPVHDLLYVANSNSGTVTVVNGTERVATVRLGGDPTYLAVDPSRGWVYVLEPTTGVVKILNGTRVEATVTGFVDPSGALYDPTNGYLYVGDRGDSRIVVLNGSVPVDNFTSAGVGSLTLGPAGTVYAAGTGTDQVAVINGTTVEGVVNLSGSPGSLVFDAASGYIYATVYGNGFQPGAIEAIQGLRSVGSALVPLAPVVAAYDPSGALLVVAGAVPGEAPSGSVALVSTMLGVTAALLAPIGDPAGSADAGTPEAVTATLWAVGNGTDRVAVTVVGSVGLSCPSVAATNNSTFGSLGLSVRCVPELPGLYRVGFNVTDAQRASVGSWVLLRVYPVPTTGVPVAQGGGQAAGTFAYVNGTVTFSAETTGGTGRFAPFLWNGVPPGHCAAPTATTLTCALTAPGHFEIRARTVDSNGVGALSPPLGFDVFLPPAVGGVPVATRAAVDIGEAVGFLASGTVGTGGAPSFTWNGAPGTACSSLQSAQIDCVFDVPGTYDLSVQVTDGNGRSVTSPVLAFPVYPLPSMPTPPWANRSSIDVGQPFQLGIGVAGSYGSDNVSWVGLPADCGGITTPTPVCLASSPGVLTVAAQATDVNGGSSLPSPPLRLTVYPDPTVTTPNLSADSIPAGGSVSISTEASGGDGQFQLSWYGLPTGCTGSAASVRCTPAQPGTYIVSVAVQDGNGFRVQSPATVLNVVVPPAVAAPAGVGPFVPPLLLPSLLAAALGAGLVFWIALRRLRRPEPPSYEVDWDLAAESTGSPSIPTGRYATEPGGMGLGPSGAERRS